MMSLAEQVAHLEAEVKRLQAGYNELFALSQSRERALQAFAKGATIEDNPYRSMWYPPVESLAYLENIQHEAWEEQWRDALELQLLRELAVAVKTGLAYGWVKDSASDTLRHFIEKYEDSGCPMPADWP